MPKKIDATWDKLILEVRVANPKWGGTRIQNAIISWGQKQGLNKDDAPSVRTIEKRIQAKIDDEKLISIKRAYFPESFESGDIPWEAAPYVIEFINMYPQLQIGGHYDSGFIDGHDRPTIRAAKHYYHLCLATGEESKHISWGFVKTRCIMATQLAFADVSPNQVLVERTRRKVEGWLRYEPWIKLQEADDDGTIVQLRFEAYMQYIARMEASIPISQTALEITTDMELIQLGIRPDQWPEVMRNILNQKDIAKKEENNA